MFEGLFQPFHLIILALVASVLALPAIPFWRILEKAGYPGPLGLVALIPVAGTVILLWLAFNEWPVERAARSKYCSACGRAV